MTGTVDHQGHLNVHQGIAILKKTRGVLLHIENEITGDQAIAIGIDMTKTDIAVGENQMPNTESQKGQNLPRMQLERRKFRILPHRKL